jgi:hypothetical protein
MTRGSPRIPNCRPLVCSDTSLRTTSSLSWRARATLRICKAAFSGLMCGVQAASRSRYGVNRYPRAGRQAIALAVFFDQLAHAGERFVHVGRGGIVLRAFQELGAGRRKIGASRSRSIVAAAGCGGSRLKITRPRKVLADQLRPHHPIPNYEAASGLPREERPGEDCKPQGKNESSDHREQSHAANGRSELSQYHGDDSRADCSLIPVVSESAATAARVRDLVHTRGSPRAPRGSEPARPGTGHSRVLLRNVRAGVGNDAGRPYLRSGYVIPRAGAACL